jgi:glycosyltransferase involved in cell wall biosynthesis
MKLLISAYACAPNRGSEHGSAWNWTTEANRLGHEVWVLVSPAHRDAIAAAVNRDDALKKIRWVFPDLAYWPLDQGIEPKWERTYNLLWQKAALRTAKALHREVGFDFVHHLTWGGVRAPTFLGSLGTSLIIGPIGGGETSPMSLRDRFPLNGKLLESLRDLSNATIHINPLIRRGLGDAAVIFARTTDTQNLLSPPLRDKTLVMMELGVSKRQIGSPRAQQQSPSRLLYAGRLLYWKGVHIAIEAMATLVTKIPDARLTIVGNGPEEKRLKADVSQRKLARNVDFISWMPQDKFFQLYDSHDLLVFPSLHDSTGWVVLEALCHGMPVACLDLGGPKDIVTAQSGIIVNTSHLTTSQVASRLAEQIYEVLNSPSLLARLSVGAIARANEFLLSDRVTKFYEEASRFARDASSSTTGQANSHVDPVEPPLPVKELPRRSQQAAR